MKTMKLLIATLLLGTSLATAQSFTNVVSERVDDKHEFNFEIGSGSDHEKVNVPVAFFMTLSSYSFSNPVTLKGELKHNGVTYSLFDNYHPNYNPTIVRPIDAFFGENKNGNWKFTIWSQTPVTVENWGVVPIAPEPSTVYLAVIGGAILIASRRKK